MKNQWISWIFADLLGFCWVGCALRLEAFPSVSTRLRGIYKRFAAIVSHPATENPGAGRGRCRSCGVGPVRVDNSILQNA